LNSQLDDPGGDRPVVDHPRLRRLPLAGSFAFLAFRQRATRMRVISLARSMRRSEASILSSIQRM
jgi:hypothetical protein